MESVLSLISPYIFASEGRFETQQQNALAIKKSEPTECPSYLYQVILAVKVAFEQHHKHVTDETLHLGKV